MIYRASTELSRWNSQWPLTEDTATASHDVLQLLLRVIWSSVEAQARCKMSAEANPASNLGREVAAAEVVTLRVELVCAEALSAAAALIRAHPDLAAVVRRPDAWMFLLTHSAGFRCAAELVAAVMLAGGLGHNMQVRTVLLLDIVISYVIN